jgi:hypothetical protein
MHRLAGDEPRDGDAVGADIHQRAPVQVRVEPDVGARAEDPDGVEGEHRPDQARLADQAVCE